MARLATVTAWSQGEDAWVAAARAGDREAFDRLVRARFAQVHGALFRLVGNHEDAEDLAQECFVRAYRSLRFYRGDGHFGAWLLRIAVHLAHDHHRRRGRAAEVSPLVELEAPVAGSGPEYDLSRRELARALRHAVDALPGSLRVALSLRVLEGLEYDDVARATGLRPGTIRAQVMKARRILTRVLAPWLERSSR